MKRKIVALITAVLFSCMPVAAQETQEAPATIQPAEAPIDKVQVGMSYEDVVKALGIDGQKAQETVIYVWPYSDGSGVLAVAIRDGLVIEKQNILSSGEEDITLEKYNKIQAGMSYEEVKTIMGKEGSLDSSSDLAGIKSEMYTWKAKDGFSSAVVMFQNGSVVSTSQFGLK